MINSEEQLNWIEQVKNTFKTYSWQVDEGVLLATRLDSLSGARKQFRVEINVLKPMNDVSEQLKLLEWTLVCSNQCPPQCKEPVDPLDGLTAAELNSLRIRKKRELNELDTQIKDITLKLKDMKLKRIK